MDNEYSMLSKRKAYAKVFDFHRKPQKCIYYMEEIEALEPQAQLNLLCRGLTVILAQIYPFHMLKSY